MDQNDQTSPKVINWKKIAIWTASVLVFIILLLVIGGSILEKKLPEQLKSQIHEETEGIYQLEFDEMDVSLLTGSIHLKNIQLTPDTGVYAQLKNPESSDNLFKIDATYLSITGFKFLKFIFKNDVQLSSLTLNKPDLIVMKMLDTVKIDSAEEKSLYAQMPEFLKNAKIDVVRINDLSFVNQEKGDTSKRAGQISGLSLALESLFIDSLSYQDSTNFWFCKDIQSNSKNIKIASADGMYKFSIAELRASVKEGTLAITDFKVIPQYPEIEFSRRLGTEGDRYHIIVQDIAARNINFKQFEEEGRLRLASFSLKDAELRIFNNKTLPESGAVKAENFPNIAMKRLDLPLTVDTLFMKNFAVYYKELSPKSEKAGTVFFTNLYGTLHNVTNDSLQWEEDPWCRSNFQTNFLGNAKLLVDLNLNMADKDGEFNYKGSLGPAEGKFYNQLIEPMAMARIEKGNIKKVNFSVDANRYGSTAEVLMLYDDLEVTVLGKDGKVLKKKGLLSFLANNFLVKNSNPRKEGDPPIEADISHSHPQDRSFFNLMWKSIFTGLKVNLGIPDL